MLTNYSEHAQARAQQRGIPPLVQTWLLDYGEERYDGRGAIIRYFNKDSVRRMERDFGRAPLKRLADYLRCYLVESAREGRVITVGKRHSGARIRNK
jgi:hypothetical protein